MEQLTEDDAPHASKEAIHWTQTWAALAIFVAITVAIALWYGPI